VVIRYVITLTCHREQAQLISTHDRLAGCELRRTLDQILANTRAIENTAERQLHVLNDAHNQICRVTKARQKSILVNP
jgi:hypothetical protein